MCVNLCNELWCNTFKRVQKLRKSCSFFIVEWSKLLVSDETFKTEKVLVHFCTRCNIFRIFFRNPQNSQNCLFSVKHGRGWESGYIWVHSVTDVPHRLSSHGYVGVSASSQLSLLKCASVPACQGSTSLQASL